MAIEDYTFADFLSLNSVIIGRNVTIIGSNAFKGCFSLFNISLPYSVFTIKDGTFLACSSLTSLTISENVKK